MTKPIIPVGYSLWLKDYDSFAKHILPSIEKERAQHELPPLDEEDKMNLYLDMLLEHGSGEKKR